MSTSAVVKSFSDKHGWGWIDLEGSDVFMHINDCVDGRPQEGDEVSFDIEEDAKRDGQLKAVNVTGCSRPKGKGKGKNEQGTGAFEGRIKSWSDKTGYGYIDHDGTDIYIHISDCTPGTRPKMEDWVRFDMEDDKVREGQMKAANVTGCTGINFGKDGKGGKGFDKGGSMFKGGVYQGNNGKGKGKVQVYTPAGRYEWTPVENFGANSAAHNYNPPSKGGWEAPVKTGGGKAWTASLGPSSGGKGTTASGKGRRPLTGGAHEAYVKSFSDKNGFGFIDLDGADVFVHFRDCVDGRPQVGDWVRFDQEPDPVRGGGMKAFNVTGCTGVAEEKGFGKGGGGYGPVRNKGKGAASGGPGPYGKGNDGKGKW